MGKRNNWTKIIKPYVLTFPVILLFIIFILVGFLIVIKESLGYIPSLGLTYVSFNNYKEILNDRIFLSCIKGSLYIALSGSMLSLILGCVISYALIFTKNKLLKITANFIIKGGVILPYMYAAFMIILTFSNKGLLARLLENIFSSGFIMPTIIYDKYCLGTILAFSLKGMVFISMYFLSYIGSLDIDLKYTALTLGIGEKYIFKKIYIPLAKNILAWSTVVIFVYYMGAYEVPMLLNNIKNKTIAIYFYELYISNNYLNIPKTFASGTILFLITVIVAFIYYGLLKFLIKRMWK